MAQQRQSSRLEDFFRKADTDGSGSLTPLELAKVVRASGYNSSADEIMDWFLEIDKDKSGHIDLKEFLDFMNKKSADEVDEADLRACFKTMDADGSGFLSPSEIRKSIRDSGRNVSDARLDAIVKAADSNNDGRISIEEFIKAYREGK